MPILKPVFLSFTLLIAALSVSDLSAAQSRDIPVQNADNSHVAQPPPPIEPDMKGYGTRGVEGRTLREMLDKCRNTSGMLNKAEQARCDQLLRTLKNQPGNDSSS